MLFEFSTEGNAKVLGKGLAGRFDLTVGFLPFNIQFVPWRNQHGIGIGFELNLGVLGFNVDIALVK